MNEHQKEIIRSLPWTATIVSTLISGLLSIISVWLLIMGGWWILLGSVIGIPAVITFLGWIKRFWRLQLTLERVSHFTD